MSSPIVGYVIIIACHIAVARFIRRHGAPSHKITARANKEVNRALIALALTPIVSLTSTATIIGSEWLEIPVGLHLSGFLSLAMTLLAFTNPLVTILCVYSYRKGFMSLVSWRKTVRVAPSTNDSAPTINDMNTVG
ncbi:hypothetical protein AAVH_14813 [Aphelenchoides avenae]|nr:hypothetical protein AAVH_14813 [Aphelenchus avenae]